ncbi:16S rRNA (uracil(1498)-N(3))-methyltransferase [Enterococcus ratti]|uniref:Ribosomal RNA small subunit methyltransferase E n=1 Tax=Enterococcus ratti TaxID=150033 RepID=A0A1L8WHM6_9ENTE|nr:16S rRNA (uracil(1498)-N(3))-methyltransferase [Enterococcus ratti]OJG80534.1 RsmE family RNA methyltransferase [Enterococcus ratti]
MQRYFLEEIYQPDEQIILSGEAFHHIVRVMRMTPKDQVYLVFKDQLAIRAEIIEINEDAVYLIEIEKEQTQKELPNTITIASGYPKGDKLDWIVQKGTELGAYAFIGFPAKTSIVKWDTKKRKKRQERLKKIAQEAAEQSHRQVAPQVELLENQQAFLECFSSYDVVLVAYEESAKQGELANLAKVFKELAVGKRILAVFGPEGGFTLEEIEVFIEKGGILCGLGPRILRTETAPLYLLSVASYQWELDH